MSISVRIIFALLALSIAVTPQNQKKDSESGRNDDGQIVISTTFVELDVTVTDQNGVIVSGLKPEDFQLFDRGQISQISSFSVVTPRGSGRVVPGRIDQRPTTQWIPGNSETARGSNVRRTFAIVVDDLSLSFDSIQVVQQALRKFIANQVEDGDLVAIVQTSRNSPGLRHFSFDRHQLLERIGEIRWNPSARGSIGSFDPIAPTLIEEVQGISGRSPEERLNDSDRRRSTIGALSTLNWVVRGMDELPGRKSVILFSEGLRAPTNGSPSSTLQNLKALSERANKSSVVIHTIDPRGLQFPGMANADDDIRKVLPDDFDPTTFRDKRTDREDAFAESQKSLQYLAKETHGLSFINQNDLENALSAVVHQDAYYLIGYIPDDDSFDSGKERLLALEIRTVNPRYQVRYNSVKKAPINAKAGILPPRQQLIVTLDSPFGSNEVKVRAYPTPWRMPGAKNSILAFLNIDVKDLEFTQSGDGKRKAKIEVLVMMFDVAGEPVDRILKSFSIELSDTAFERALDRGLIHYLSVPVSKAGKYQIRIAVRDNRSGKIGTSSNFVEVPDFERSEAAISRLFLEDLAGCGVLPPKDINGTTSPKSCIISDSISRRFKTGSNVKYSFVTFLSRKAASKVENITFKARLIRDGKLIVEGPEKLISVKDQADPTRFEVEGLVRLTDELPSGVYSLQVIVSRVGVGGRSKPLSQAIDFVISD